MAKLSNLIVFTGCLLFGLLIQSDRLQAQPRGEGRDHMPDSTRIIHMVDDLAKAVALTDEQKKKIIPLHFEHFNTMKKMHEKNQGDREAMRKARDEMQTKLDTQIKALLDDKQKTAYDAFMKERRERREMRGRPRPEME